jgi:hypothetical protein
MEGNAKKKHFDPATIEHWFTHAEPTPEAALKYRVLHETARQFALGLNDILPADARETARAFDALEELVAWSNAAIARDGG